MSNEEALQKATPGDWIITGDPIVSPEGTPVCDVMGTGAEKWREEEEANKHLLLNAKSNALALSSANKRVEELERLLDRIVKGPYNIELLTPGLRNDIKAALNPLSNG